MSHLGWKFRHVDDGTGRFGTNSRSPSGAACAPGRYVWVCVDCFVWTMTDRKRKPKPDCPGVEECNAVQARNEAALRVKFGDERAEKYIADWKRKRSKILRMQA
jgi:hypothetical protein